MKIIKSETIINEVKRLCMEANYKLPSDIQKSLLDDYQKEDSSIAKETLKILQDNSSIASTTCSPICQDTGMACVFVEIGQDVYVEGSLKEAINEGVRQGY